MPKVSYRTDSGSNVVFTAQLDADEILDRWPNWTKINIAADGAPNNASSLQIASISFSNPADGTHPGDDTFLMVQSDGKWEKGVAFPDPYQAVESGEEDELPDEFEFRASISKNVQVQDAKLNITYCEED